MDPMNKYTMDTMNMNILFIMSHKPQNIVKYITDLFSSPDDHVMFDNKRNIITVTTPNMQLLKRIEQIPAKIKITDTGFNIYIKPRVYTNESSTSLSNSDEMKFNTSRIINQHISGVLDVKHTNKRQYIPTYKNFPMSKQYYYKIKQTTDYTFVDLYVQHSTDFNKYLIHHQIRNLDNIIHQFKHLLGSSDFVQNLYNQSIKIKKQHIYAIFRKMHQKLTHIITHAPGEDKDGFFIVYRGIRPERNLIQQHSLSVVQFGYFTSTSIAFSVAYHFASKDEDKKPGGIIIYQIQIPYKSKYLYIGTNSLYDNEKEILLPDTNVYNVLHHYKKINVTTRPIKQDDSDDEFDNPGDHVDDYYILQLRE